MTLKWASPTKRFRCAPANVGARFHTAYLDGIVPGGSGARLSLIGFVPDADFSVTDNGDGTWQITDAQNRFGVKPNAGKPLVLFDLSDGGPGDSSPLGRIQIAGENVWGNEGSVTESISSIAKPGSSYSRTVEPQHPIAYTTPVAILDISAGNNSGGRKWMYYTDWHNDWTVSEVRSSNGAASDPPDPDINVKWMRFQHNTAQAGPYCFQAMQSSTQRFVFSGDGTESYDQALPLSPEYDQKQWNAEQQLQRVSSSAGATDAYCEMVKDGKRRWITSGIDSHKGEDPIAKNWDRFKITSTAEWAQPGVARFCHDLFYLDDSWCRLFISDQASWDETILHSREIQIPQSWAPGEIVLSPRQGSHTTLSRKYLWAVDNDNNEIRVGRWL